jgi:hypothetical protein
MDQDQMGEYQGYDCSWEAGFAVDYMADGVILFGYAPDGTYLKNMIRLNRDAVALLARLLKERGYISEEG